LYAFCVKSWGYAVGKSGTVLALAKEPFDMELQEVKDKFTFVVHALRNLNPQKDSAINL